MIDPGALILEARTRAGLSQSELAARAETSQSAIARIERAHASPTVATLERLLAAAGCSITVALDPALPPDPVVAAYKRDVDVSLIRANLARSVDERLGALEQGATEVEALAVAVRARRSGQG
jgi:transcriptional regulator with XRE-family HTH domain